MKFSHLLISGLCASLLLACGDSKNQQHTEHSEERHTPHAEPAAETTSSVSDAHTLAHKPHYINTVKTGADIIFSYEVLTPIVVGEAIDIQLNFEAVENRSPISIELQSDTNVVMVNPVSSKAMTYEMQNGLANMTVTARVMTEGQHYLSVLVYQGEGDIQSARSFGVPLSTSSYNVESSTDMKPKNALKASASSEEAKALIEDKSLIVMPASESIE